MHGRQNERRHSKEPAAGKDGAPAQMEDHAPGHDECRVT
jgi:hypothetical protein